MNKFLPIICLGLVLCSSCKTVHTPKGEQYIYIQKEGKENKKWKLVWEDNFNGAVMDSTKWSKIPSGTSDWDRHMSSNADCYDQSGGKLYLRGIKNPDTLKDPRPYLTGGVYTKGKFAFQYGKIEIYAKL